MYESMRSWAMTLGLWGDAGKSSQDLQVRWLEGNKVENAPEIGWPVIGDTRAQ